MRRMISGNELSKIKLLKNVVRDEEAGRIVSEDNIEFNGDVEFTGIVTGVGGTQLYKHMLEINNGTTTYFMQIISTDNTPISQFELNDSYISISLFDDVKGKQWNLTKFEYGYYFDTIYISPLFNIIEDVVSPL